MENKLLLSLLEDNARIELTDLAAALDESQESVKNKIKELESNKTICGYHTIINWDKTNTDVVTALIQIHATPEREHGYDRIAKHIYKFHEVDTVYLLSGNYEFLVLVKGRTMQEVARFVSSKLACVEGVSETSTFFVLKQYKSDGIVLGTDDKGKHKRLVVTP